MSISIIAGADQKKSISVIPDIVENGSNKR